MQKILNFVFFKLLCRMYVLSLKLDLNFTNYCFHIDWSPHCAWKTKVRKTINRSDCFLIILQMLINWMQIFIISAAGGKELCFIDHWWERYIHYATVISLLQDLSDTWYVFYFPLGKVRMKRIIHIMRGWILSWVEGGLHDFSIYQV